MSYGLKVLSTNGTVQIDSDSSNKVIYQLSSTGTVSIPSRASLGLGYDSSNYCFASKTDSSINSNYSLIFVKPSSTPVGQSTFAEPGTGSFTLYSSLESTSYKYYVFNPTASGTTNIVTAPSTGDYGLVVYDTDGTTLKYSSAVSALRVKDVITNSGSYSGTGLIALQQRKYSQVKPAAVSPLKAFAWVTTFNSNSISHGTDLWFIGTTGTGATEDAEYLELGAAVTTIIAATEV